MLKSLKISNYALIDSLEIGFEKGFSIITGETGAGKSILLGAVSLILGQRADTSVLKDSDKKCFIEGVFYIKSYNLQSFFKSNEIDYDDETIIRREIAVNGKSRAFINDTPVNLGLLKDLGSSLVDIHSQHQNLILNDPLYQLKVVDTIAQNQLLLDNYQSEFKALKEIAGQLKKLTEKAETERKEFAYYSFQVNELNEINLDKIIQEELENELEILNHTEEIKAILSKIVTTLDNDEEAVLAKLKIIENEAQRTGNFYRKAGEYAQRIESVRIELDDIVRECEVEAETIDFDPKRIDQINKILDKLFAQQQKHRVTSVKELIEIREELSAKIEAINSFDDLISETNEQLNLQNLKVRELADKLSHTRKKTQSKIEKQITAQLQTLGMPNSKFEILIEKTENLQNKGQDVAKFLFSANKSVDTQEISKVASGGEVSRLMLCVKALISESLAMPSLIFDEIDTGVSGDIADKMGDIMKQMSGNMQLLNITHLPQIAAKGDHHYLIFKKENSKSTETKIKLLTEDERINELAKMLSGANLTEAAIQNAKELLKMSVSQTRLEI